MVQYSGNNPSEGRRKRVMLILVAAFATVVVAGLAVAITLYATKSDKSESASSRSTGSSGASGSSNSGTLSGSDSDWYDAVCQPASLTERIGITGASASSACAGTRGQTILWAKFEDNFSMRSGMATMPTQHYATGTNADGSVVVVSDNYDGAVLNALTQFGFVVQS